MVLLNLHISMKDKLWFLNHFPYSNTGISSSWCYGTFSSQTVNTCDSILMAQPTQRKENKIYSDSTTVNYTYYNDPVCIDQPWNTVKLL